jgi:hypothetical protein
MEGSSAADMPLRQSSTNRQLAITHRFTLQVPSAEAEAIQQKHLDQCAKLNCTVLSNSIDRSNEGRISARASVRISPEAYPAFAVLLAAPPAKITMHAQSAEDLATPIFDAEKRLAVKIALRDRLTAMLNDASVKTAADLITIEKELSQAQSEIEIITAQRDQLRTRTDTVRVEIFYSGVAARVGGVDLSPIHQSIKGIGQTLVSSVAWLISFLVAVVPWLPVIALIGWAARRGIRRWKGRKVQAQSVQ